MTTRSKNATTLLLASAVAGLLAAGTGAQAADAEPDKEWLRRSA